MTHDELREAVARIVAQGKCKYMPEYTVEEWEGWRKIADRIRALIDGGGLVRKVIAFFAYWGDTDSEDIASELLADELDKDCGTPLYVAALKEMRSQIASPADGGGLPWKCRARAANTGANDPQDCDWPICGCDPYANKVIAALQESRALIDGGGLRAKPSDIGGDHTGMHWDGLAGTWQQDRTPPQKPALSLAAENHAQRMAKDAMNVQGAELCPYYCEPSHVVGEPCTCPCHPPQKPQGDAP